VDTTLKSFLRVPAVWQSLNAIKEKTGTMIHVHDITKNFGSMTVLDNVNFSVEVGEFLTIVGPNGAGKTTLIKIMATLVNATGGTVEIGGFNVKKSPEKVRLKFFGKMYAIPEIDRRVDEVLGETGLADRKHDRVGTFSRGMKQRLSIARAILHNPSVLLLDEPYTGLDQQASASLESVLNSLTGSGITTIMISHDLKRGLLWQYSASIEIWAGKANNTHW
jgi:ABC-type multidrug transport system ATPase subunit